MKTGDPINKILIERVNYNFDISLFFNDESTYDKRLARMFAKKRRMDELGFCLNDFFGLFVNRSGIYSRRRIGRRI